MICKNCTQKVVAYHKSLTVNVIKLAKELAIRGGGADVADLPINCRNSTTIAKSFGLVEKGEGKRMWHLTELGRKFVEGKAKIPTYIRDFEGEMFEASPNLTGINDVVSNANYFTIEPSEEFLKSRRERMNQSKLV